LGKLVETINALTVVPPKVAELERVYFPEASVLVSTVLEEPKSAGCEKTRIPATGVELESVIVPVMTTLSAHQARLIAATTKHIDFENIFAMKALLFENDDMIA
jgi:hypothetical protein